MDTVELKFTVTPDEAKALLDTLLNMRTFAETVPSRGDDVARAAHEIAGFTPPPPPPFVSGPPTVGNDAATPPAFTPPPPPPAGPPTVNATTAAPVGKVDSRGVPWHIDHHSGTFDAPGLNADGTWKKRRGHIAEHLKSYEAQYLGNASAPSNTAGGNAHGQHAGNTASHASPPPPGTPGMQDLEWLWASLVASGQATPALEQYVIQTFGAHPVHGNDLYKAEPHRRLTVYNFLKPYDVKAA